MPQGRYSESDIQQAPVQRGQYSEADVLPEQSLGAGLTEYGQNMGEFFHGLWNKAKGAVGALLPDDPSKAAVEAPIRVLAGAADALHSHIKNLQALQDKAEQSLSKGDIADFLGHMQALSAEGVVPGIGQAADAAKAKWDAGDKVGATADAAALTSQALLGAKSGDLVKGALNAGAYTVAGAKAAAPGVIGGLAKAGVGEVIAKVPGMELPARFGLQYPAIRQVAKALEKGAAAGRAAIAPEAATAATETAAPRPVRASKAPSATTPPASPPPEVPPAAPGKTAADLLNEEMGTKEAAPPVTAKAPGQALAESHGETWSKLSQDDKLTYAQLEGAQASSEARNAPAPSAYTPRPPEYYGVKAAEAPPTNPAPSAPAPAQATSAAPPQASAAPTAAEPTPEPLYHATRQPEHAVKILESGKILPAGGGSTGVNFVSTTTQPLKNYSQAPAVFEIDPTKVNTQPFDFFAGRPQMINGEPVPGTGGGLSDPRFEFEHRAPGAIPTSTVKAVHINPSLEAEDAASIKAAADKAGIPVKEGGVFSPEEPPQPKPASGAANAKAQRYADAITKWAQDQGISPSTAAEGWEASSPETRGRLILQMRRKGYLGANETIPNTSAPIIVDLLKSRAK